MNDFFGNKLAVGDFVARLRSFQPRTLSKYLCRVIGFDENVVYVMRWTEDSSGYMNTLYAGYKENFKEAYSQYEARQKKEVKKNGVISGLDTFVLRVPADSLIKTHNPYEDRN